jgi:AcrR family transcriptional regulator
MESRRRAARRAEVERNDRALLDAARAVLAEDGAHASVATIAARAGVGIGTLYRRYRTKEELFQHLCTVALNDYLGAAEGGLAHKDPWDGLVHFVVEAVLAGTGALAPIAGTIDVTQDMTATSARGNDAVEELVSKVAASFSTLPSTPADASSGSPSTACERRRLRRCLIPHRDGSSWPSGGDRSVPRRRDRLSPCPHNPRAATRALRPPMTYRSLWPVMPTDPEKPGPPLTSRQLELLA